MFPVFGSGAALVLCSKSLDSGTAAEQLPRRNVKWFRDGLLFKAHRLLYHSTLDLKVIKKHTMELSGTPPIASKSQNPQNNEQRKLCEAALAAFEKGSGEGGGGAGGGGKP